MPSSCQYLSDGPITHKSEDLFNRAPFADRIAQTIATRTDPSSIVIGIYGAWGDGKTSVLEMMTETLSKYENIVTIKFNPWIFQSEELLLRGFFATLADALQKTLPTNKEKFGTILNTYGSVLSFISLGEAAKDIGKSLSTVSIDEERKKIETILEDEQAKVVVFIDDIDRLDRNETHAIFKLVKLSANFRYTTYVLAFDHEVVSAALGERYGQGGQEAGQAFLEKIIQVPLHLPPAEEISLRNLAIHGVNAALTHAEIKLTQTQADTFLVRFIDGFQNQLTTPRLAKLYSNALMFALPLLKGEVNPIDLMLIEGVRVFYPRLYKKIHDNPSIFLGGIEQKYQYGTQKPDDEVGLLLRQSIPNLTDKEYLNIRQNILEPLFPRVSNTTYANDWAAKQNICSYLYFHKYFLYAIPSGDISDVKFNALLENFHTKETNEQQSILYELSEQNSIPKLIEKLRKSEEVLTEGQARAFLYAVCENTSLLPRERGLLLYRDTWTQASILVAHLLKKIDKKERREVALHLMSNTDPVNFCIKCMSWIHLSKDTPEEDRIISEKDEEDLKKVLVERIQYIDKITPLYKQFPQDATVLYNLWKMQAGRESVSKRLVDQFNANPSEVDLLIRCYASKSWSLESGIPLRGHFEKHEYNALTSLLDVDYLVNNLQRRYGAELNDSQFEPLGEMSDELFFAYQFMECYTQAQKEKEEKENIENNPTKE